MITIKEMLERGCLFLVNLNGDLFIPLKPVVDILGLNWEEQLDMLQRDPLLSEALTPLTIPDEDGNETDVLGLTTPYFAGWTLRLDPNEYSGKLRDDIIEMQRKCYATLAEWSKKA